MSKEERFNLLYQKLVDKYKDIDDYRILAKEDETNTNKDIIRMAIVLPIAITVVIVGMTIISYLSLEKIKSVGTIFLMCLIGIICIGAIAFSLRMLKRLSTRAKGRGFANEAYHKDYKEKVINEMIKTFAEDVEYKYNLGLDEQSYIGGEFEYFDRYYSEDLITGTLESDTEFSIADVYTYKSYTDSEGNTRYRLLYNGLVAKIEMEKSINSSIYVRKDSESLRTITDKYTKQVELDSQEFESLFNVCSDNKIVTMQILTSDIMNMLIDFYREIPFEVTIKNNNIYIRFFTGNGSILEKPELKKEALDKETLYRYYCILDFIFELINKLQETINKTKI